MYSISPNIQAVRLTGEQSPASFGTPETTGEEPLDEQRLPTRWERARIRALRLGVNALFSILARPVVTGRERIPTSGPCLLVFNHISNLDPPLIFGHIARPDLTALVAAEYRVNGFYRRAIEWAGGAWIQRGASDRAALRFALDSLQQGWIVGIAPEGGRSKKGRMREAKPGPAFLALHAGVPILPVGVAGTKDVAEGLRHFRRVPVSITFGEPFRLPETAAASNKERLAACTTEIMCQIAALVPAEQRGVYADHPRLLDILQSRDSAGINPALPGTE